MRPCLRFQQFLQDLDKIIKGRGLPLSRNKEQGNKRFETHCIQGDIDK
jgi:hypothetical protein